MPPKKKSGAKRKVGKKKSTMSQSAAQKLLGKASHEAAKPGFRKPGETHAAATKRKYKQLKKK